MPVVPTDIYGRYAQQWGGSFAADSAVVTFGGANALGVGGSFTEQPYRSAAYDVGMLTQRLKYSYRQRITRLYEIGSSYVFYVAGRPEGEGEVNRVVGPRPVLAEFYLTFGNVCFAGSNNVEFAFRAGCYGADPRSFSPGVAAATGLGDGNTQSQNVVDANTISGFPTFQTIFRLVGFLLDGVSHDVASENMIINENMNYMFLSLQAVSRSAIPVS